MCGIAGLMRADGRVPDPALLDRMAAALAHRGPDGSGRHVQGDTALVQVRLAIIDLATGDQPFYEPGGAALVGNGEIYNYVELWDELKDCRFATKSDCEPPLHLYRKFGPGFADRLRGMYALAIHDPGRNRLILARDPFGIKPLYYAETETGFFFASEPRALIAAGAVGRRERAEARDELLALQFTTGRATIFAGIERVLPGETLIVERGRIVERARLAAIPDAPGEPREREKNLDLLLYDLDAALADSVGIHQRSDVPYGMFLSGGVDSSALLALMARLNQRPVLAFTIGFPGTAAADERALAKEVARAVGAEHVEAAFDAGDFWNLLPQTAAAMDDPAADYAILPTYKLAREARKSVKVILSGEGGDELFAGYGRYRSARRPWPFAKPMRRHAILDGLGILREMPKNWRAGIAAAERAEAKPGRTPLQLAQAVDIADWLPNDLLGKLDRCLMAHGLEGRVPFLDPKVAAFAFHLADAHKIKHGLGKWLLRAWLEKTLPAAKPFSKKRGFTVPVGEWIGAEGARLGRLVAAREPIRALCHPEKTVRLFEEAARDSKRGFAAWTLLFYALWHRAHIEGIAPEGDAFACLAE